MLWSMIHHSCALIILLWALTLSSHWLHFCHYSNIFCLCLLTLCWAGLSQSRRVSLSDPSSHGPFLLSDDTQQSDVVEFHVSKSGQSPFWQNFNKFTSLKNGKKIVYSVSECSQQWSSISSVFIDSKKTMNLHLEITDWLTDNHDPVIMKSVKHPN